MKTKILELKDVMVTGGPQGGNEPVIVPNLRGMLGLTIIPIDSDPIRYRVLYLQPLKIGKK